MNDIIKSISQNPIVQICWVVDDMEKAARRWIDIMGAGPFFLIPHIEFEEVIYRGKPSTLDQSSAIGQWGSIQVELFEQHCNSPAGMRDLFAPGQIQHMTWMVDDLEAESHRLEALGFPEIWSCKLAAGGLRIKWFDAKSILGSLIEVYEDNPGIRMPYGAVAKAAESWRGENPIRRIDELVL